MHDAGWVVGFHGCDETAAEELLRGASQLVPSRNPYDWLGDGAYFWEGDARRALQFATRSRKVTRPSVIGAYLHLGHCLDLTTQRGIGLVSRAHERLAEIYAEHGWLLPTNRGGSDRKLRYLDRAVINYARKRVEDEGGPPIDSVRGAFPEEGEAYPGAGFTALNHIQIAILDPRRIRGVFRPETGGWLMD